MTIIESNKLASLYKMFSDETRLNILYALYEKPLSVFEITEAVIMSQSAVSHQLRLLKDNVLVKNERVGKQVFYSLADDHVKTILDQGLSHIRHI